MANKTSIEWTDYNWNFLRGCSRVSEGCRNCYAEGVAARFSGYDDKGKELPYFGLAEMVNGKPRWTGEIKFLPDVLTLPLRWTKPRKVFVNSMSDLFHEKVTDEMLDQAFAVMALTPQHTYQILTKRPERMKEYLSEWTANEACSECFVEPSSLCLAVSRGGHFSNVVYRPWPLPNVWLGVSIEDQKTADERIPFLLDTPAAVRWISAEPLLGPIDLIQYCYNRYLHGGPYHEYNNLDWVVVGGESGPNARPMYPAWARFILSTCKAANIPFFFKQWGNWGPGGANAVLVGSDGKFCPTQGQLLCTIKDPDHEHTLMSNHGKKAAGRILCQLEFSEYPNVQGVDSSAQGA